SGDVDETIQELEQVYSVLPKQLIHRDVHLGNFLFEGQAFSGYVDFDLSQSNIRIFDLCYFLLGILCEESKFGINTERWFDIVKQVIGGYHSILPLNQEEQRSIACVMKSIELLFVAYFLGIGDEKLAEDAGRLFYFVKKHESRLKRIITT
ncbi:MAG: phosphotransferase, partial [Vallitaleaceae bacterium]|nr:phosphotransferase [Vallitaleaceae bacterium]